MIVISIGTAFFLYVLFWFIVLLICWGRELWRDKVYNWALSEGNVCNCDRCHFAFIIRPGESAERCPKCNEVCKIRKRC